MFDIIFSQAKILEQFGGILNVALLVFSRSVAFVSMAPLLGHKTIPVLVRISFAVLLTLIMFPILQIPAEYPTGFKFVYLIIVNVIIGLIIGWVTQLILEIGKVAGGFLDMQMGLSSATLFDPASHTQVTIIGKFLDSLALVIFISVGGIEKVIEALYRSYNIFPAVVYHLNINFEKLLKASTELLAIGFLVVSPIIITILVIDLILGLMSRAAPQINAFQISFSIKPTVAILLIIMLLPALMSVFSSVLSNPTKYLW